MIKSPWIWRRLHLRIVMRDLLRNQPTSISEIAHRLGTSTPTISQIMRRPIECGLIVSTGQKKGRGGRPKNLLRVKPSAVYALVINVSSQFISIALVDASLEVVMKKYREAENHTFDVIESILESFEELTSGVESNKLAGVSVILPSALEYLTERAVSNTLSTLRGVKWRELLEKKLQTKVVILSDVKAYAIGEWLRLRHIPWYYFYLHLGKTLDGVLISNGHVCEVNERPVGKVGGIVYAADLGNDLRITRLSEAYERTLHYIENRKSEGKTRMVYLLSIAVTNVVALMGVKHVILGGPYSELLELNDLLEIEQRVWKNCHKHDVTIEKSSAKDEAPFVGGAMHLFEEVFLPLEE